MERAKSIAAGMEELTAVNVVSRSRGDAVRCLTCGSSFTRAHGSCPSCGAALSFGGFEILRRERQQRGVPRLRLLGSALHGLRIRHTV